ncbi:plexin A3-like [Asterias amurensis]|uniref:plexin A3-like n=1 Tax=Asterias amurensis TaxID=7602 RepID=UPI003AB57D5E
MAAGACISRGYRLGNLLTMESISLILLLQLVAVAQITAVSYEQFEVTLDPGGGLVPLQRMALDKSTETLFVGAVNRLYKLSSDLQLEGENITGPKNDNQACPPPPRSCSVAITPTNNINKALVVNEKGNQLIVCGSVYQGVCKVLRLNDMSIIEQPSREVVTNTEQGSNVVFIAPGPSGIGNYLYSAASRAMWLRGVPTVAKRLLSSSSPGGSTFDPVAGIQIPENTIDETAASNTFDINYMFGFSSGNFSYFIATQLENFREVGSPLYTKIVRLCQDDTSVSFDSYIELPLVCKDSGGVNYNLAKSAYVSKVGTGLHSNNITQDEDILFVTFSKDTTESGSVVCMYPVKTINERFLERVKDCANQGTDTTEIDWLGSSTCVQSPGLIALADRDGLNYCHQSDTNTPLGGLKIPIEAMAIYSHSSAITAIAVTPHFEATVVLLGDELGHLKKLRVQSLTEAQLYEELPVVEGSPVVQNGLMFDKNKNFVYFMTERKISKVPIQTCETMTTCEECLSAGGIVGDPHCGWCPLLTRCTRRLDGECPGASSMTNHWIGEKSQCIMIQSVTPPSIPSDSAPTKLEILVTSLPKLNSSLDYSYECVFGDLGSTSLDASMTEPIGNSSVYCHSPDTNNVQLFEQGSLSIPLSIRSTETDMLIVNTTFDLYNCSAFDSCTKCVDNAFMCNWCVHENRCMGDSSSCIATGVVGYREGNTTTTGKEFCPRIELGSGVEILLPAGETSEFRLIAARLPVEDGYECVLRYEDRVITTPATKMGDNAIICSPRKYNYTSTESFIKAKFSMRWNDGKFLLDNPSDIHVTLYKCAMPRTNCGKCLMLDRKFDCGWCESTRECSMESRCGQQETWLNGEDGLCPDPTVSSFHPQSGHIRGNTNLTILGYNLGKSRDDVIEISVAGIKCDVKEYSEAERIVCLTQASTNVTAGRVKVMLGKNNTTTEEAESKDNFTYVVPVITSFRPADGPKSGGTRITLYGTDLNAGSQQSIIAAGMPCSLDGPTNVSQISCITSQSEEGTTGLVVMTFDDLGEVRSQSNFSYAADPVINSVNRMTTILSGGLLVEVNGDHLNVIQEPQMVFYVRPDLPPVKPLNCFDVQDTSMTCKTPDLSDFLAPSNNSRLSSPELGVVTFGFILDGVETYKKNEDYRMTVYLDPEYFRFEEEGSIKEVQFGERTMITIQGRYVKETYQEKDVKVFVGSMECISLTQKGDNLTCPVPDNDQGDEIYDVRVEQGNLNVTVGRLRYLPQQLSLYIIIGAVCGGAFFIIIILFIVCICRRISANERRFKKMEVQRDEMEMRVAQECKDAFAELQITVLTVNDVEGSGIPFHDYRDYAARILFPWNPNHPVFREIPVSKENITGIKRDVLQKGLVQFGNLIGNQTFLTIFLHTLEAQKTLSLKDLSNIASLLVIALHNRMDFLMEAIKSLLQENIQKYVDQGCPQLLLRRSEAVVEKLVSHWLSLLMYDSLRESMGKPLFHLFYAIKQQVDKGPVDSITGEARYGLSEMKVIRQQIDFKTLNIFTAGLDVTAEPIQLKVLNCDTISQTKEKILDAIYKAYPYSKRPSRDELDLEWSDKPQGSGSMVLLDEDVRGRLDGEWKRVNTLAHYQVPDGATLRLVRAQVNGGSLPNSPARKYGLGTLQTSPATSASPIIDPERGSNQWHLVKHVDSGSLRKGERDQKMMAEIYLPRLLTTKGILQQFVDNLLETIFKCDKYDSEVPLVIKYYFDFLDDQARLQGITDPDVVHGWKSNSLQLRFWVNLIKNPDILFDINKSGTVDACLSTIGQTLIDACSVSEQTLTKDSPSNKLLYAKDIPTYKEWVANYYKEINNMAAVSDQDMGAMLAAHTNKYQNEFQPLNALNELYFCYACIYKSEILQALDEDKDALKLNLGDRLEDIFRLMADSA